VKQRIEAAQTEIDNVSNLVDEAERKITELKVDFDKRTPNKTQGIIFPTLNSGD
jgi:hypothetical protein